MGSPPDSSTRKKHSENAQTQPRKSGKFDVKPLKPAKAPAVAKKAVAKPAKASSNANPYELKSVKKTRGNEVSVQTYKTTDQFIEEWKSLDDAKIKQLSVAWSAARDATWSAARSAASTAARDVTWSAALYATLSAAWSAASTATWNVAWPAAWCATLAVLLKDKIPAEEFEILTLDELRIIALRRSLGLESTRHKKATRFSLFGFALGVEKMTQAIRI